MSLSRADSGSATPAIQAQESFWDVWNRTWRFRDLDAFMQMQHSVAQDVARRLGRRDARILDVGCGTGWLGASLLPFGRVWGIDLSMAAVAEGRRRRPGVQFVCGDFLALELPRQFDFVVSADAINNCYDPALFVSRIANLLLPGGTFLLMTPNRTIWQYRSALKPLANGQIQHWPSRADYRGMLEPCFEIDGERTLDPGGDRSLLWWVENRWVRGGMGRLLGRSRWRTLLERAQLGREVVIVSRRR